MFADEEETMRLGGRATLAMLALMSDAYHRERGAKPGLLYPVRIKDDGGVKCAVWLTPVSDPKWG